MKSVPTPKKSLGQHWLEDLDILETISNLADIEDTDTVLEIGPGYGNLTKLLVEQAGNVIAVELDKRLADQLYLYVSADNLEVVNESILKFDLSKLPPRYKIVANIPYYLTSNLLRLLSESNNPPEIIVLLVQKEVAERVCAKPGAMSLLSVTTQYYWETSLEIIVPAKMFVPPPKVDSQVILLKRREKSLFTEIDDKKYFRLVKVGYSARRKTLLNSLSNGLRVEKSIVEDIMNRAQINLTIRPQMLDLVDWYEIYKLCVADGLI